MRIRKRVFYLRQKSGQQRSSMFGLVCRDLQDEIEKWLGEGRNSQLFASWPVVAWQTELKQVYVTPWSSENEPQCRLLNAELTEKVDQSIWTIRLQIGAVGEEEIVIQEECQLEPIVAKVPYSAAPDLLNFLTHYECKDADDLLSGRVYSISKDRALKFADFIRANPSERRLPIVLISPRNDWNESKVSPSELATALNGVAHVMSLSQRVYWAPDDLFIKHRCYNGAVRVYLPGYSDEDDAAIHRFWLQDKLAESEPAVIQNQIIDFVLEKSWIHETSAQTLGVLDQMKQEEERQHIMSNHVLSMKQRIQEEAEVKANKDLEPLFEELIERSQQVAQDYERMSGENKRLQDELRMSNDEIRRLKYLLNQQWMQEEAPVTASIPATSNLYFSHVAVATYQNLDAGTRNKIDTELISKLFNPEMRENQSEPVKSVNGKCSVYPRSKTADGCRTIYTKSEDGIKVLELFIRHDDYERERNRGFDLSKYTEFEVWDSLQS